MIKANPLELKEELSKIVDAKIMDPVVILGQSGVGKTSIVNKIFGDRNLPVCVVHWGNLAPVDGRGVPVPNHTEKATEFYPPKFWPKSGPGVVFLDEFNLASTTMMALGQEFLRDGRFGDYRCPPDMFRWVAGNRKIDMGATNEIPGPVNNRCAHYEVEHDFPSWEIYAHAAGIDHRIIGYLKFVPDNLYKFDPDKRAWPSGRSWEMADRRLKAGISIASVIGEDVAVQFDAHLALLDQLPNLELVHRGLGRSVSFPDEPSLQFAVIANLEVASMRSLDVFGNCLSWLVSRCATAPEWIQAFVTDTIRILGKNSPKLMMRYIQKMETMQDVKHFVEAYTRGLACQS